METNYQFKSAPKRIPRKLKNLFLDDISDGKYMIKLFAIKLIKNLYMSRLCQTKDVNHQQFILIYHQRAILLYHHHQKNHKKIMIIIILS